MGNHFGGKTMGNINDCAEISEMIYWATHSEEQEEKFEEKQQKVWINYDVSPLIELALSTKDEEWFYILTSSR